MSNTPQLPNAGYLVRRIYCASQSYKLHAAESLVAGTGDERQIAFNWDWQYNDDAIFQVVVALAVKGNRVQPEEARVVYIGEFTVAEGGEPEDLPLRAFVTAN